MPLKAPVPPEGVVPEYRPGCEGADTTRPLPPEEGVLKDYTLLPTLMLYQVPLFQEVLW